MPRAPLYSGDTTFKNIKNIGVLFLKNPKSVRIPRPALFPSAGDSEKNMFTSSKPRCIFAVGLQMKKKSIHFHKLEDTNDDLHCF